MSREALQESLSAVMDNEADELELRRVLAAAGDDAELRGTWSRYQLARAVMHKELLEPRLDIAAAVSAADELSGAQLAQQAGQPSLTLPQVQGPAVLAGYTESAAPLRQNVQQPASGWYEQRLPNYLRQHAQQAAASGTDSVLPYARAASLENR